MGISLPDLLKMGGKYVIHQ